MLLHKIIGRGLNHLDRVEDKAGLFHTLLLLGAAAIVAFCVVPHLYEAWEQAPEAARDAQVNLRGL